MWLTLVAVVTLVILLVISFAPQLLYAVASLRYSPGVDAAPSATLERRRSRRVHWRSPRTRPMRIADA
jgi:hypothetical protein